MTNKKYYKKNLFFTERYYFKGAYIYIGCYLGLVLAVVFYFFFVNWLYGMNLVVQHQLKVCLILGVCMIIPIPVLIWYGNKKYWKDPPILPNWKKYEGKIMGMGGGLFCCSYEVVVNLDEKKINYSKELDIKDIDPYLALAYAREDDIIDVMINMNNIYEGKILTDEYFARQQARNLPRVKVEDCSYKYNEIHEVNESQKVIIGELDRNMTTYQRCNSLRSFIHFGKMDAVISYYEKETGRKYLFYCSVLLPGGILLKYVNHSKTSIPVEIIVEKGDYSKYTVLLNKALEEKFGLNPDPGWFRRRVF